MSPEELRYWGLEPCDELLTCIMSDLCPQCDPRYAESNKGLKIGRVYRAKGHERISRGWYIPELSDSPEEIAPGVHKILLYCSPHFGKFDKGTQNEEIKETILQAKRRAEERKTPVRVPETAAAAETNQSRICGVLCVRRKEED